MKNAAVTEVDSDRFKFNGQRFILTSILSFIVWLLLVGNLHPEEMLTGLMVSLLVATLSSAHLKILDGLILQPYTPLYIVQYLSYFLIALIRANADVARRVLTPQLPIHPAMVEVKTNLKSTLGKLLLANSITLTPGTLTVDVINDRLLIHWIDSTPGEDLQSATYAIAYNFEKHIQRFLK